jgi:hypothetical protein
MNRRTLLAVRPCAALCAGMVYCIDEVDDPVSGERYLLNPRARAAEVLKGRTISQLVQPPFTPPGITVEQWFSPDLGMIVRKTGRATTGGASSYRLEHIVQGDPDPMLFAIPAGYTRHQDAIASN